jgi:hypothetical protein
MKKARARVWSSMVERLMKICMGRDGRIGCLLDSVHIFRPMLCVCLGVQTFIFPWLGWYFFLYIVTFPSLRLSTHEISIDFFPT